MGTDSKYYREIITKLERFIRKEHIHIILSGIQLMLVAAVASFTFLHSLSGLQILILHSVRFFFFYFYCFLFLP